MWINQCSIQRSTERHCKTDQYRAELGIFFLALLSFLYSPYEVNHILEFKWKNYLCHTCNSKCKAKVDFFVYIWTHKLAYMQAQTHTILSTQKLRYCSYSSQPSNCQLMPRKGRLIRSVTFLRHLFTEVRNNAVCLICGAHVAVFNDQNCHYITKKHYKNDEYHARKLDALLAKQPNEDFLLNFPHPVMQLSYITKTVRNRKTPFLAALQ